MTLAFTAAIFTSAFLLFLIQPMISKLLLPQLGGSPAVWNTSMLFFQTFLLLGYVYAHLSGKWLGAKKQSVVHIILLLLALAWLPVALKTDIGFSSSEHPITWVILSLFFSVGLPFFVLAANAPLLQSWIANTSHKNAKNPYFLYSASNAGSLLALLGYPFLIEPSLALNDQTGSWSWIFVIFILMIAVCAVYLHKHIARPIVNNAATDETSPSLKTKIYWLLLAAAPSSLMLGLTTYITTDIAAVPLFWVIPLALYLITFIAAFSRYEKITDYAIHAQGILVPLTVFAMVFNIQIPFGLMILHVLTFFVTTMVCHGTLARCKPGTKYLTEFYVWMSLGGMLGGVFNALVAPNIFTDTIEYSIVFFACLLLRPALPGGTGRIREWAKDIAIPVMFSGVIYGILYGSGKLFADLSASLRATYEKTHQLSTSEALLASNSDFVIVTIIFLFVFTMIDRAFHRPLRFMLMALGLYAASTYYATGTLFPKQEGVILAERNFFGILRVYHNSESNYRSLMHGTTMHGIQSLDEKDRLKPVSYYSPLIRMQAYIDASIKHNPYAVLGLGAGTLACVGLPGQHLDIYEIDPAVVTMANDPALFTYLKDCPTKHTVILGDGRLAMAQAEDKKYKFIVMDAFTSDAVPVHLLTREALAMYKSKLADKGIIAFHISNRYLDLEQVIAAIAADAGMKAIVVKDYQSNERLVFASHWVFLTEDANYLKRARRDKQNAEWSELTYDGSVRMWTDNYSNMLQLLKL